MKFLYSIIICLLLGTQISVAQTQLFFSDEGGAFDETVRVKLTAKDFNEVTRFTTSITWSIAVVEFEAVCIQNLPGLNIGSFDYAGINDGLLTMDWNDPTGQGITWPDGQVLLEICFKVKGPLGSMTPVNLVDNPVPTAIFTIASGTDPISISKTQGSVTVTDAVIDTLKIFASQEFATPVARNTCVKVTAEDFNNIQGFQFSMAWDASELDYTGIGIENIAGINFDVSNVASGILPIIWDSPVRDGISMADGETLFEVCFNAQAVPVTTTMIAFVGIPNQISAADQFNRPMFVETNNGSVTIDFQPVNLLFPDTTIDKGDQFCIDVASEYFFGITEFEFAFEWDESVLQYEFANTFTLDDFNSNNFDTDNISDGELNVFWTDPTNFGAFVANGETIFQLCFTAIGDPGQMTNIESTFSSRALSSISDNQNVGVEVSGGKVTINDFFAETISVQNTTCTTKDLGAIDVNVIGGTQPLTINWSNNETTEDISGLNEGFYTITITDSSNPPRVYEKTFEIVLDDPGAPTATINQDAVVDCLNSPVQLDGTGSSQGGYNYEWITTGGQIVSGATTLQPTVQGTGVYILNVTDAATGCCSRTVIDLENAIPPTADAGQSFELNCYNPIRNIDATNSTVGNNIEFNWSTNDGNIIRNEDTPFPAIDQPGTYELMVVDTETSCSATTSVTIGSNFTEPTAEAGDIKVITCDTLEQNLNGMGSSEGMEFSYEWTTVDGFLIGGENSLMPTVNAPGFYFITVLDQGNGCEAQDSIRVFGGSDLPFVDPGPDLTLDCNTTELIITGANAPQGPTFEHYWYTNDGNIVSNWNTMTPTIDQPGTYAFEVYNRQTNCRNISSITVFGDYDTPDLVPEQFRYEFPCHANELEILVNEMSGEPSEYNWISTDGQFAGATNFRNTTVRSPGTYVLTARNLRNGCESEVRIFVEEPQIPEANIMTTNVLDCKNEIIQLTGTVVNNVGAPTLRWFTNDGNIIGDTTSIFIQVDQVGEYFFEVETDNGCSDLASFIVEQDTMAPMAILPDSAFINCSLSEVDLDGSGSTSGNDITFNWETNDGNFINSNDLTATVDESGFYFLTILNELNGCDAIDSIYVERDTTGPNIVLSPMDTIGCGGSIQLDASGSDVGDYDWEDAQGGNIVSGDDTAMPTVNQPGLYTLTLTDPNTGCESTAETEVIFSFNLPSADAGADFSVCENAGQLNANLPTGVTGEWKILTAGAELEDITLGNTDVLNLLPGRNTFVWFLSADDCPNYSSDTLQVTFAENPITEDDLVEAQAGQTSIAFNILNNDDVPVNRNDYTVEILNIPQVGNLVDLDNGQFRYEYSGENAIGVDFQYEVCSVACPDLCSQSTVTISFEGIEILNEVPNVITPNGDGLNDEFFFESIGNGTHPNAALQIFNRWGDVVFKAEPYQNNWRGQNNSDKELPHGTYYFVLKLDPAGQNIIKGNVTIMN